MKYPENERLLIIRPCLKAICLGVKPAAKLLSALLYQARNCPDDQPDFTIQWTQEQAIRAVCEEFTSKTLHDTAIPCLQLLGYLDVDTSTYVYQYTVHLDLISRAFEVYGTPQLEEFLIVCVRSQLEKVPNELEEFPIELEKVLIQLEEFLIAIRKSSNSKRGRKPSPVVHSEAISEDHRFKRDITDNKENTKRESVAVAPPTRSQSSSQETMFSDADTEKKEVVRGPLNAHKHPIVDRDLPANRSQPDPPRADTNKVKRPPAPDKSQINVTPPKRPTKQGIMDEISLTPDEQAVFDAWCSLFRVDVPLIPANAKASKQLVKPLQVWTGILDKSTAEVLKLIMNWSYKNDKNGYYKRGFKLYDAAREFEAWQSAQERPPADKDESNEHRVSSFGTPGYNFADEFYPSEAEKKRYRAAQSQSQEVKA